MQRAVSTFEAGKAKLYSPDGRQLFSESEHQRRMGLLVADLEAVVADAQQAAGAAIRDAEERIDAAEGADPVDALTDSELQRAALLREFVREDADGLALPALLARVRAVLAGTDRVRQGLYGRYVSRRLQREPHGPGTADAETALALAELTQELIAKVGKPGENRAAAQERLRGAKEVRRIVGEALREARGDHQAMVQRLRSSGQYAL